MIIPGVDASYDTLDDAEAKRLRAAGVQVWAQCLWTGSDPPAPRVTNLRVALNNGFIIAGYISVTGSHDGYWHVGRGQAGVPPDIWDALALVFVDVELDGIPNLTVRQAVDDLVHEGKRRAIYTSYNAWVNKQGSPTNFTDCLLWNALWDENPDIDFPGLPYGGWQPHQVVAEQWSGGQNVEGVFVDRDSFVRELLVPQEEKTMPTLEQLEAAIAKERADRELGAAWLSAAIAYADAGAKAHKADTLPHLDSEALRRLDAAYEARPK